MVTGAAEPNLLRLLGRIEETAGGKLFVRSQAGVRPTMLGAVAIDRARVILTEMQEADNALERVREAFGERERGK
jgi:DNA-binding transcriptional LysR family regulator